jgi:hypothetical protein
MEMNKIILTLLLIGIFVNNQKIIAQQVDKTITQKIEKKFEYDGKGLITIDAERGNIHILGWKRNEVSVVLVLIAKNNNLDLAKKELSYMKYSLAKSRNNIFLNNRILLPDKIKDSEISSILKAEYEIYVPEQAIFQINNNFGSVSLKNVNGKISGYLHYSDLSLQAYCGNLNLSILIGDFNCTNSSITGEVKTQHSAISFADVTGKLNIETNYGNFKLAYGEKPADLVLNSNATEIFIENNKCHILDIQLNGSYCPLKINNRCYTPNKSLLQSSYQPVSEQKAWLLKYRPQVNSCKLRINASFGSLNLM